ncbi:MAG: hypothetical protein IPK98_14825 [Chloracidobacterium sp.]|nr:hypothetical protein [Chloracidobacterium sp.]
MGSIKSPFESGVEGVVVLTGIGGTGDAGVEPNVGIGVGVGSILLRIVLQKMRLQI